jgi:hypothetical protein
VIAERFRNEGLDHASAEQQATFILSSLEGALILSKTNRNTDPLKIVAERLSTLFASK